MGMTLEEAQRRAVANEDGWLRQFGDEAIAVAAGEFPRNGNGYAYVTSLLVKGGLTTLYGFSGYNSNAAAQFIQVFDAASLGAVATGAVPEILVKAGGASNFSYDAGHNGRRFLRGVVIANSSTGPTYTAGAADCWFDVQFV